MKKLFFIILAIFAIFLISNAVKKNEMQDNKLFGVVKDKINEISVDENVVETNPELTGNELETIVIE